MAKKFVVKPSKIFPDSIWGKLSYPNEFINSPEGKMPLEIYLKKHNVAFKVRYDQTKEKVIHSAPPKFIPETTSVDFGLIFENGLEIKGVGKKFWNGISTPLGTDVIVRKIRPEVKMAPKLKEEPKRKKDERTEEWF